MIFCLQDSLCPENSDNAAVEVEEDQPSGTVRPHCKGLELDPMGAVGSRGMSVSRGVRSGAAL